MSERTEDVAFRDATAADESRLVPLVRAYYAEEGYTFVEKAVSETLRRLLADPSLGRLFVADADGATIGYCVVTYGYSVEYRGRDAFVDEIFFLPAWRGRGLGARALVLAEEICRAAGVQALHLEAERKKPRLVGFYRRAGFEDHDRRLMTKWLGGGSES